jgi:Na+-translocating ferredoxin:NAD+ oxidoreductase RnfD subunit
VRGRFLSRRLLGNDFPARRLVREGDRNLRVRDCDRAFVGLRRLKKMELPAPLKSVVEAFQRVNPYDQMIFNLAVLTAAGAFMLGAERAVAPLATALAVAVVLDHLIIFIKERQFRLHKSPFITGLFVGTIMSPTNPLEVVAVAAALAILSKHVIRFENRHVFNPAMFGILNVVLLFPAASHAWWAGSWLPGIAVLVFLMALNFERLRLAAAFLIAYFGLNGVQMALQGQLAAFLPSILGASTLYFFLLMLIEPKTSPQTPKALIAYGVIVALAAFAFQFGTPGMQAHSLHIGLLVGNGAAFLMRKYVKD